MADDMTLTEAKIIARLKDDDELAALVADRVYPFVAKRDSQMPYVIVSYQAGTDDSTLNDSFSGSGLRFLVKAVGDGRSFQALSAVTERINDLMSGWHDTTSEPWTFSARVVPIRYLEQVTGDKYIAHSGASYRITTSPLISE